MKKLTVYVYVKITAIALLIFVTTVSAQPYFDIKGISVNWPDITLHVAVKCSTLPTKSNYQIKEDGKLIQYFYQSCDTTNKYCCISVALVFDRSGSMAWGSPSGIEAAKAGGKAFIDAMDPNGTGCDEATVISFREYVTVDVFMTNDKVLLKNGIDALIAGGGTAVWDAGVVGVQELVNNGIQQCRAVVLLTDGEDNASFNTVDSVIAIAKKNKIIVYTVGLGNGINEQDLIRLATETGGKYYNASDASKLLSIFKNLFSEIATKPYECDLMYQSTATCLNGERRTVDVTLSGLSACPGPVTKSITYNLPKDSSTLQPIEIKIGTVETRPGQIVSLPLSLETSISDVLEASMFTILFDETCVQFFGMNTAGFLFSGIPFTTEPISGGFLFRTGKPTAKINGSDILAMLKFKVPDYADDRDCPITLKTWIFSKGCFKPVLISGMIQIRRKEIIVSTPHGGERWCAGRTYQIRWTSKNISMVKIDLSNDGGLTYPILIADNVPASDSSYDWNIPFNLQPRFSYRIRIKDSDTTNTVGVNLNTFEIMSPPIVLINPSDQSVCIGDSVIFTSTISGTPAPSLQWQMKAPTDSVFVDMIGETLPSITVRNVSASQNRTQYRVYCTNLCNSIATNPATLTVNSPPSILTQPKSQFACLSRTASFNVVTSGAVSSYQWRKDYLPIIGATNDTYSISSVTFSDAGVYDVLMNGPCAPTILRSNTATLSINPAITITSQPKGDTICSGSSVTFSVNASGANLKYQWRKDGFNISGATSAAYTILSSLVADTGNYDVVIRDTCTSVQSGVAKLVVNTKPTITSQPQNQTVCEGSTVTLALTATGVVSYQWRKNGVAIPGTNSSTFTINNVQLSDSGKYSVLSVNSCGNTMSNDAILTVGKITFITVQPSSQTVKEKNSVTFMVAADGLNLTYQWKKNGIDIPGANGASYTILFAKKSDEGNYSVVVTGQCGAAVTSNIAALAVTLVKINEVRNILSRPMLYQNYPNPFGYSSHTRSDWTVIRFAIPQKEIVKVSILDLLGREKIILTNREYDAGEYSLKVNTDQLQTGLYFYLLRTPKYSIVKRMTVIK